MTVTLAQLRAASQVLADMVGSPVLLDPEWDELHRDGIRAFWADVTSVNKDFRVNTQNFALTSTQLTSLPSDFREVRFVRRDPGTQNQKILNKWGGRGVVSDPNDRGYRIQGSSLYIDPLVNCAGTYDLLYVPSAPVLPTPDFTVRLTSTAAIMADDWSGNATVGPGHTLTSGTPGAVLTIDSVVPSLGDRFLLQITTNGGQHLGLYAVSQLAAAGVPWKAVRTTDFDTNSEIRVGQNILVTDGAINANTAWRLATFADIDVNAMTFAAATTFLTSLDAEIEQHRDYIELHAVIEAMGKTESDSSTFFRLLHGVPGTEETGARGRVKRWASDQRSADPDKVEDVRGRRRRGGW